jgi:hypothetical protein
MVQAQLLALFKAAAVDARAELDRLDPVAARDRAQTRQMLEQRMGGGMFGGARRHVGADQLSVNLVRPQVPVTSRHVTPRHGTPHDRHASCVTS